MKNLFLLQNLLVLLLAIMACDSKTMLQSKPKIYSNALKSPEAVVKVFCDLDANGKRLSSTTWPEMLPYIMWPDEPGWDTVFLVTSYKLNDVKRFEDVSEVTVKYQVVGKYSQNLQPMNKTEKVIFKVIKTEAGWKIKSPDFLTPHVFPMTIIKDLEDSTKETRDLQKLEKIQNDIRSIRKLNEQS